MSTHLTGAPDGTNSSDKLGIAKGRLQYFNLRYLPVYSIKQTPLLR